MGSPWKMFTQAQGQELINGTNSTWTTINGVNGRKFTSKTDSSKYIFLPSAGQWSNTNYGSAGLRGHYWSTSWISSIYSWYIWFDSSNIKMKDGYRYLGMPIRPVQ